MNLTLQNSTNGFALPAVNELISEERRKREAQLNRDINALYLMANAVVSRVEAMDEAKRKLILVVDDEPLTFGLIYEFLEEAKVDCEVLSARSGQKAYDIAIAAVPNLIVTDWLIPDLDGKELIQQLKANPVTKDIPVIMITGVMAPYKEFDKVLQSGAIDYLRKPLDYEEFKVRVRAALALDESLKEVRNQQDALEVKNQLVDFLIDGAPNPIFYQDKWGRLLGCNRNFERLCNRGKEEIIGQMTNEFLPSSVADALETHFLSLEESGDTQKFEIEMPVDEENSKHLIFSYVGLGNSSIEIVIGSITDITEIVLSGKETLAKIESILQHEKEQFTTRVGKLRAELDFKHRELSMHLELLIHSKNVKEKLIDGVNKLQPYLTEEGKSKLHSMLKNLQWTLHEEEGLNTEKKFDEVNSGLYGILEKACPEITKNEKRLCAYLKMNHGASDIAKITDRSLNSVNVGFARLRAKLGLPNTKDLRTYLNELAAINLT